jgi:hypothetical protein
MYRKGPDHFVNANPLDAFVGLPVHPLPIWQGLSLVLSVI